MLLNYYNNLKDKKFNAKFHLKRFSLVKKLSIFLSKYLVAFFLSLDLLLAFLFYFPYCLCLRPYLLSLTTQGVSLGEVMQLNVGHFSSRVDYLDLSCVCTKIFVNLFGFELIKTGFR